MKDIPSLRLERSVESTQKLVDGSDKGLKLFRSALFEVVAFVLLVALFFYENGTLVVKKQDLIVFIGNIAVMFILSMLFDNNYRIKGKLVGFSTEKYIKAYDELLAVKKSLSDDDLRRLDEKTEEYAENELEKRRRNYLYKNGITLSEFEELRLNDGGNKKYSAKKRRAVNYALKMKKSKLTTAMLLSETDENDFIKLGKSGRELDKIHNLKTVATYLVSAVVFAYFAVALSEDFSLAAFGWYMMKVCFLVFRGIKSYFESYMEVTEKRVEGLTGKKLLLEYFLGKNGEKQ